MDKYTNNAPVQYGSAKRLVVILLFVSMALQALAFAIPGDAFSLLCRAVGVLLLIVALLVALKGGTKAKFLFAIGIGVVASLAAVALVAMFL